MDQMSLEIIKSEVEELNYLGKKIIKLSNILDTLDERAQVYFAQQLLTVIDAYYQDIEILREKVKEYKEEEIVPSLEIHKLQKDLEKFR